MCFYIHRDHYKLKTAEEDIVCYKEANKLTTFSFRTSDEIKGTEDIQGFISFYRFFDYKFGETYGYINLSEHEFSNMEETSRLGVIHEGFHSYIAYQVCDDHNFCIKCFIPKGTRYFYNPDYNEYVSERIRIGKVGDLHHTLT